MHFCFHHRRGSRRSARGKVGPEVGTGVALVHFITELRDA